MSRGIIIWAVKIIERIIIKIAITITIAITTSKSTLSMGNIIFKTPRYQNTIIKNINNSTTGGNNPLLPINLHIYYSNKKTTMRMIIISAFHTIPIVIRIIYKRITMITIMRTPLNMITTLNTTIITTSITKDNSNHKSHHHQKSPNKSNVHLGLYWGGILHLIITKTIKTINMLIIMWM